MDFTGIAVEFFILANAVVGFDSGPPSDCGRRSRPDNGQVVFTASKNWSKAVEVYQCDSGYALVGETKHTCVRGQWSGQVPSCRRHTGVVGHDDNTIGTAAQGWFSFRRILKPDAKRKLPNNEQRSEHKSIDVETPPRRPTLGRNTFQLPMHMIRDSAKEYSAADYDLSCLFRKRHGKNFLRAPKIPFAHVAKYSKKTNAVGPSNKYLEAIYRCVRGHVFENPSENRLYCSNGHWVGKIPSCVPKTTPMTIYQMECYIKCPPDKNISLAVGKGSTTFDVERPVTNYDWDRFGTLSSGWSKNSSRILVPGVYVITYTVQDQEDADIASCRTTVQIIDDEPPAVQDCPLYLEVVEDFSTNDTVPVSWTEPGFTDNVAVTQVAKTMEPGRLLGPGLHSVQYIAMDASMNEAVCGFNIEVIDRATIEADDRKISETRHR